MPWKILLQQVMPIIVEALLKALLKSLAKHKGIDNKMAKVMLNEIGTSELNDVHPLTASGIASSLES